MIFLKSHFLSPLPPLSFFFSHARWWSATLQNGLNIFSAILAVSLSAASLPYLSDFFLWVSATQLFHSSNLSVALPLFLSLHLLLFQQLCHFTAQTIYHCFYTLFLWRSGALALASSLFSLLFWLFFSQQFAIYSFLMSFRRTIMLPNRFNTRSAVIDFPLLPFWERQITVTLMFLSRIRSKKSSNVDSWLWSLYLTPRINCKLQIIA